MGSGVRLPPGRVHSTILPSVLPSQAASVNGTVLVMSRHQELPLLLQVPASVSQGTLSPLNRQDWDRLVWLPDSDDESPAPSLADPVEVTPKMHLPVWRSRFSHVGSAAAGRLPERT